MSNYDVMVQRQDSAPDEKRVVLEDAKYHEMVLAALNKWLTIGAVLTKDAGLKGRHTLQFKPGAQANLPVATQPFPVWTIDNTGDCVVNAPGAYIVHMTCETTSFRYTTSGKQANTGFGMLVPVGTYRQLVLQDISNLWLCATAANSVIDIELLQIDA